MRTQLIRTPINLSLIAAAAYVVGSTASDLTARAIRPPPMANAGATERSPTTSTGAFTMAERNLFGARREPPPPPTDPPRVGCQFNPTRLRACTMRAELRGTMVAQGAPEWSLAVLKDRRSGEVGVHMLGAPHNRVDDAVLCAIGDGFVVVRRDGHFERCLVGGESVPPSIQLASLQRTQGSGIRRVADGHYEVDRAELEWARQNFHEIAKQVRIVPRSSNSFRILAIKKGSLFDRVGLRNNDVLVGVNGEPLGAKGLLELYERATTVKALSLQIERRGKSHTHRFTIID